MHITLEKMQNLIEKKYIQRGKEIVKEGMVGLEKITTRSITATVIGTGIYTVFVQEAGNSIIGNCSCPAYQDFGPCKHMASACLAYLQPGYTPSDSYEEQKADFNEIIAILSNQTKEQLIAFIIRLAAYDQEVMYMIQGNLP